MGAPEAILMRLRKQYFQCSGDICYREVVAEEMPVAQTIVLKPQSQGRHSYRTLWSDCIYLSYRGGMALLSQIQGCEPTVFVSEAYRAPRSSCLGTLGRSPAPPCSDVLRAGAAVLHFSNHHIHSKHQRHHITGHDNTSSEKVGRGTSEATVSLLLEFADEGPLSSSIETMKQRV